MIGLYNSSVNCLFCLISLLTPPPEDFFSKNLQSIETRPLSFASYFGFLAILNALYLKTLSEAAFFC